MSLPDHSMSEAFHPDPWVVFEYEVEMFLSTRFILQHTVEGDETICHWIRNALSESAVLHARNLVEILRKTKSHKDDIVLQDLLPDWRNSNGLVSELDSLGTAYCEDQPGTARWAFNKKLAHATLHRTDSFDYTPLLNQLDPIIISLLIEISQLANRPRLAVLLSQFLKDARTANIGRESA
jgi:hypothetical protein